MVAKINNLKCTTTHCGMYNKILPLQPDNAIVSKEILLINIRIRISEKYTQCQG